jgi:hypothetical protein
MKKKKEKVEELIEDGFVVPAACLQTGWDIAEPCEIKVWYDVTIDRTCVGLSGKSGLTGRDIKLVLKFNGSPSASRTPSSGFTGTVSGVALMAKLDDDANFI